MIRIGYLAYFIVFFSITFGLYGDVFASGNIAKNSIAYFLNLSLPSEKAIGGTSFIKMTETMSYQDRDDAVFDEVVAGNVPSFLRRLTPVSFSGVLKDGKSYTATFYVTPDYICVGNNKDYVRMPVNFLTALRISEELGMMIPTKKMVDLIFEKSKVKLTPQLLPVAGMTTSIQFAEHNRLIKSQFLAMGALDGQLVSGHKKDIVLTKRLLERRTHDTPLAIYGWHKANNLPIQYLSTVHEAEYSDYSQGLRLVSKYIEVNGKRMNMQAILENEYYSAILSDDGIVPLSNIMALYQPLL